MNTRSGYIFFAEYFVSLLINIRAALIFSSKLTKYSAKQMQPLLIFIFLIKILAQSKLFNAKFHFRLKKQIFIAEMMRDISVNSVHGFT